MTHPAGEMPFLDHLEELRRRILWSLAAVVLAFLAGFWLVQRFQLVTILKRPIEPYLQGGKLAVLSPTEPIMIVLKLGLIVGLVLASPIILWQVWAFVAPALYEREKKALVPSLFVGMVLFFTGAILAFQFVVPQALRVLFSFQSEALTPMITYSAYFAFVLQVVLALGLSFELPLVIIILAWLGVVTPAMLHRFRRVAVVGAFIAGAVLSPGADVLSMVMMTVPLLILYEIGFVGAVYIHRRRLRAAARAAAVLFLLLAGASTAGAQEREGQRPDSARAAGDTLRREETGMRDSVPGRAALGGQPLDSATARRLGLPTAPSRSFGEPDSAMRALLARPGYDVTRYRADSATVFVRDERLSLEGEALTQQGDITLQADSIGYRDAECLLSARGDPQLFERDQVLVGEGIRYDTCTRRGVITGALTNFQEGSVVWFLRGDVANDSTARRLYAGSSAITSCDLPVPHYHFAAKKVKWVSQSMIVARPIVLYVRDVPIVWLPFLFQDTRPGRRSGILIPQFGLNDIVRTSSGYRRQITNLGYYWAPNDYLDFTARLDWYSGRYVQYGASGQYRWLNRFMDGSASVNRQVENTGLSSWQLAWQHRQQFNLSTTLNFNLNYVTQGGVLDRNAVDPRLNTQTIQSGLNFQKRFGWGTFTLGGNRRQNIADSSVTQQFPAITVTPKPLTLSRNLTWSPTFSFTSDLATNQRAGRLFLIQPGGGVDTLDNLRDRRTSTLSVNTPLRLGAFEWRNSLRVVDQTTTGRDSVFFYEDDPATPEPDSIPVSRYFAGDFSTTLDWETGINLPILFRSTWKLQPAIGVTNITSGPFALRNRNTDGTWVVQGKRPQLRATLSPTFFGFVGGVGPFARFRHSISPLVSWSYAPAARVPDDYADAISRQLGQTRRLTSQPQHQVSLGLNQVFEGKGRPAPGDTLGDRSPNIRKTRLLSISTSSVTYDFEQAREPGRTGWATQTITNSLLSDLLPGFNLSLTHDLWKGVAGVDTSDFDPFLQRVSASFGLSQRTFQSIFAAIGLGPAPTGRETEGYDGGLARRPATTDPSRLGYAGGTYNTRAVPYTSTRGFSADFNYSLTRSRPRPGEPDRPSVQSIGFSTRFSPTALWHVGWSGNYNLAAGRFESQEVRLERDLHDWRASFNFVKNPNGNFALYFSIYLLSLPDLKFDYDQTTIER